MPPPKTLPRPRQKHKKRCRLQIRRHKTAKRSRIRRRLRIPSFNNVKQPTTIRFGNGFCARPTAAWAAVIRSTPRAVKRFSARFQRFRNGPRNTLARCR